MQNSCVPLKSPTSLSQVCSFLFDFRPPIRHVLCCLEVIPAAVELCKLQQQQQRWSLLNFTAASFQFKSLFSTAFFCVYKTGSCRGMFRLNPIRFQFITLPAFFFHFQLHFFRNPWWTIFGVGSGERWAFDQGILCWLAWKYILNETETG